MATKETYTKRVFEEKMLAVLNETRDKIRQLEVEIENGDVGSNIAIEAEAEVEELHEEENQEQENLQEVIEAGNEDWEVLHGKVEDLWLDLKENLDSLIESMNQQV